ncbi:Uncharacterised protein [Mycobacteroides abscessus subsp. abscessus]|nr:Uncharacterised protein [Mycobacteroides abscessus subsp. abscessus]
MPCSTACSNNARASAEPSSWNSSTTASINSSPCHMWSSNMRVAGVGATWSSTSNQGSNR